MKITKCEFIGSFYQYEHLPKDRIPQIAFAGRSNVGKSSLLNRLTGRKKLAKVSTTPGKTRSINFFRINEQFYFVDLPGYGYARVSKQERAQWGKMIGQYLEKSPSLAGLMLLLDCRRAPGDDDFQLIDWMAARGLPALVVVTKADKLNRDQINRKVRSVEKMLNLHAIPFSATKGVGKQELLSAVSDLVA